MIKVENLTKEFKIYKKHEGFKGAIKSLFSNEYEIKKAVNNINLSIDSGELVGYIGVNGAGKSTTIKMMTGILVPTSGKCIVNNVVPYENRKLNAKNIGVVFGQRTQLWWDLPVSESFSVLQKIYEIPIEKYRKNLDYLKKILGLQEFYLTPVRNLSLGQKMRADFAASLLHDPKVVFLDEPTIGLDILVKNEIRKAIKEINKEKNTTFILTTHDIDDIEEICNRIIVIDKGIKIYDGTIKDLKIKYDKIKTIKFDLKRENEKYLKEKLFSTWNSLAIDSNDKHFEVKFDKNKVKISDIINKVIKEYQVKDIIIEDTKLEEIVKEIYKGSF